MRALNSVLSALLAIALTATPALGEVVAVVSSKCTVKSLSKNQIVEIFLGKTRRFPDGTPTAPIDQLDGSAARDEFYLRLVEKSAAQMTAYWSKIIFTGRGQPPPTVANGVEMKKRISNNPAAIGYIDRSLVDDSVRVVF